MWNEFCDWFIEMVKPRIYSEDTETKIAVSFILNYVFGTLLKLLHPFMPFVTSEIYENIIKFSDEELIISKWPEVRKNFLFDKEEETIEKLKDMIVEVRNVRTNMNIHPSKKSELIFVTEKYEDEILSVQDMLIKLGFGTSVKVQDNKEEIPENCISIIRDGIELYMPLNELVDMEEQKRRLLDEKEKLEAEVTRCEKMLLNPGFLNKAPQTKIDEEKAKLEKYKEMLEKVLERLK